MLGRLYEDGPAAHGLFRKSANAKYVCMVTVLNFLLEIGCNQCTLHPMRLRSYCVTLLYSTRPRCTSLATRASH